ncbi:MAG: CDP-glycerol glycerophosphotransferase family protein, partial [Bacteroidales bacterium]|nr:CDP-glycerol glycerophosphotransferase family protein [Bacteroidales bacterium]
MSEVFNKKLQYQCTVTGNPDLLFKCNKKYGIEFLAKKLVRTLFSIGVNSWVFDREDNAIFDTILCSGEYQKERYEALGIKAEVIASGSPRFDKENKTVDKEGFFKHYGLDKNKKTILWLPTHTKATSVVNFLDVMQGLSINYNVTLKTHASCYSEIKKLPQLISAMAPNIININNAESTELLGVGDYVFCDYGGSVFTAIYNDKNVLLLNAEDKYVHKLIGEDSPEVEIRKEIINFYRHEGDKLISALKDKKIWEEQKAIRRRI